MSAVVQLRPTRRVAVTAQRIVFDLVPTKVQEAVFSAAIAAAWAPEEHAEDCMEGLRLAVSQASQFTVPVKRVMDEPISPCQKEHS